MHVLLTSYQQAKHNVDTFSCQASKHGYLIIYKYVYVLLLASDNTYIEKDVCFVKSSTIHWQVSIMLKKIPLIRNIYVTYC